MAYKAFVASTFEDLKEHRRAVIAALRKAGLTVDPMEEWTASTDEPKTFSQDRMKNCHLCILLVAYRRGHVPQGEKRSITQLEYEAARSSGIDVLVFMLKDDEPWRSKFDDRQKDPGIEQFRAELGEQKGVGFFGHEPGSIEIAPAITRWITEKSSSSPAAPALQWPQQVVERLSSQLNDEFDAHMRAGEALSADLARARYVQGLIKLRDHQELESQTAKGRKIPAEGPLEDFVAFDAMQLLVIGGGGSGKTTMLKHLAAKGSRQAVQDARAPIVLYLRLASFDRADGGLDLLFDRLSLAAQLTRPELEALWRKGTRPIVFLLDGVNEVAQASQSWCVQALRTLLQLSPPLHRYVITSRPGDELDVLSRQVSEGPHLRLADTVQFSPERVREYLQAQGRSELQSRLSGRLEELASNPFLLWAISRTFASYEHASLKNRGSLFTALIDRYIFGEREQSKPKPRPTQYNYALIKKPVLAILALQMSDAGVTVASEATLLKQVAESLRAADREREQKREFALEAETFMPKDYAAKSFVRETVDNGILMRDGDRLRFMHESVQEYFAAAALCTSSVEDLAKRAPSLSLARLDARGPLFETLVTWAGLSTPEQVTALVEALREKHVLLAAQLAVEAGLSAEMLERLRRAFLSLTRSEHEQRQQLGARGLAIVPSEEADVLGRLIELLDDSDLSSFAEDALKSIPTSGTVSALVNAWASGSKEVDSKVASLLRELARDQSGSIVEALLDVWRTGQAPRDRVVQLAAFLDTKHRWDKDGRPYIRERLATLAVEAELGGDLQRSADFDALRLQAAQPVVAPSGVEGAATPTISLGGRFRALLKRREELTKAYGERDNAMLEQIVREGQPLERAVARDILVERRSPAAVALVVEAALEQPGVQWLKALESFPRESVRRVLAGQIEVLNGDRLARAQLLADLLVDTPSRLLLQKVFRDSGAGLRACAARAAERLGAEGVDLLIEHLGTETSEEVLAAGVQALGRSRVPAAVDFLLELVLDPLVWWHWPVSNSESWPVLIHHALVDAGAADRTMARLERVLASTPAGSLDQARHAVWEASRWLPATRAVELLRSAMTHQDRAVQEDAQVWLARAGDANAWRRVLRTALEARSEPFSLAKNVTSGLAAEAVPSEIWNTMKADSQSVLQPALADPDPTRRAAALDLTSQLPEAWVTSAWREDALSTAENLLQSVETEHRLSAVRAIFHWTPDAADRIFEILMNDPDEAVSRRAYELLGDESGRRIEARLDSALRAGDAAMASSLVERVGPLLTYKDLNRVRDTSARWLDTGNRDQCIAALLALTFHPAPEDDDEWKEIGNRARAAFERLEIDGTWQRFAAHIRPLGEHRRQFVYMLLDAFDQEPEQFTALLTAVGELWQDDIPTLAYPILIDITRDPDRAASRLAAMERRFPDQMSHTWLANQFARLDRPADALRQYRLAAAQKPTNDDLHFHVGWFAFVTRDFEGSIDATRRSLTLQPAKAMAQFNLGVALLARGETVGAEAAYKRGAALARRMSPAAARQQIEGALGDFALLPERPETVTIAVDRIRASLERERERLAASAEDV